MLAIRGGLGVKQLCYTEAADALRNLECLRIDQRNFIRSGYGNRPSGVNSRDRTAPLKSRNRAVISPVLGFSRVTPIRPEKIHKSAPSGEKTKLWLPDTSNIDVGRSWSSDSARADWERIWIAVPPGGGK